MNFEPAIVCLVEAVSELGERLANLELLADTEYEKARIAKFRGEKETSKRHLLTRRNYEAEIVRTKKLLHETEQLIGKFKTITAKHRLLKPPVSSELEIPHNLGFSSPSAFNTDFSLDAELQRLKREIEDL